MAWALGIETLLLVLLALAWSTEAAKRHRLSEEKTEIESARVQLQAELANAREQAKTLVAGRLPHLSILELDQVLPVDKEYVKNVAFTRTGSATEPQYEYKLVLHNPTSLPVQPQVLLRLFDQTGVQVGWAEVGSKNKPAASTLDQIILEEGETRSFSGTIEVVENVPPFYYDVRLK